MSSLGEAPYEALARSIEHELELIGDGRLDELDDLLAARAALIDSLPATPPASATAAWWRKRRAPS